MQRFGFSFTIILLRISFAFSCYFADVWLSEYTSVKELLLDSLCLWCIFCETICVSYVCCGRSGEKDAATGVPEHLFSTQNWI